MPRIEIIPKNWIGSREQLAGDGTPTEDVCKSCAIGIDTGDDIQESFPASIAQEGVIGSVDVDHPSYEDDDYTCAVCDEKLTGDDN